MQFASTAVRAFWTRLFTANRHRRILCWRPYVALGALYASRCISPARPGLIYCDRVDHGATGHLPPPPGICPTPEVTIADICPLVLELQGYSLALTRLRYRAYGICLDFIFLFLAHGQLSVLCSLTVHAQCELLLLVIVVWF